MLDFKVSVIVCTYNREEALEDCLVSLENQTAKSTDYEVILINNNSTDSTESIVSEFKKRTKIDFSYFVEIKQGLSFARNRGAQEAKYSLLAFVDDDAIVCNDYINEIISFFVKNNIVDACGGKIIPFYEGEKPKWMNVFLEPLMSVIDLGEKEKPFPKNKFPIGANMIFKKDIFDKIGGFNENLGRKGKLLIGGEEKDFFNKLRLLNGKIWYLPKAWVYHKIPNKRLTKEFIKKQALGIGYSERLRGEEQTFKYFVVVKEVGKWLASLLLFIYYVLTFQFAKGKMILFFRFYVSSGLIKKNVLKDLVG